MTRILIAIALTLSVITAQGKGDCLSQKEIFGEAQWIGGTDDDMALFAPYLTTFRLEWAVETDSWLTFGGGDDRFLSAYRNPWHLQMPADSVFVRVEADCTRGELRFIRSGMHPKDNANKVQRTMEAKALTANGKHTVTLAVAYGTTDVLIDNEKIGTVNLNPVRGAMDRQLNLSGDYAAFPCLGVVSTGGETAALTLRHYRPPRNIVCSFVPERKDDSTAYRDVFPSRSCLQLRTAFEEAKKVRKAELSITARGVYDVYVNGTLVNAAHWLCPGFTQYDRTQLYQTYDITSYIKEGRNRVEALLGEGWWSGPSTFSAQNWNFYGDRQSLLARLTLTYADGTRRDIVSRPDTWECCSDGSVLCASLFQGEVRDGRRKLFDDDSRWHKAVEIPTEGTTAEGDDYSQTLFLRQTDMPVHSTDTITAVSCSEVRPGVFVYDMGQNMAGVPMITLGGIGEGTRIRLRYGEMLTPALPKFGDSQGELFTENYRAAVSQDIYIAGSEPQQTILPRHTIHGFRYIEVTGVSKPLPVSSVKALALSSLTEVTAHYECSDTLINRLWQNIVWSAKSNFVSIPTDCPQRNERMGWSGDLSVFSPTAVYLADSEEFMRRHLRAMRDTQSADGRFPDVAPMRGEGFGGLLWGSAGVTVPWQIYKQWGNTEILREHYEAMRRYISYIEGNYIDKDSRLIVQHRQWGDLGDWLSPLYNDDDKSLLWECYYIHDLDIMSRAAGLLGKEEDAARYREKSLNRKAFFRQTYLDPADHHTVFSAFDEKRKGKAVNTPASYILPLAFNICENVEREHMAGHLVRLIEESGCRLMVGFIGVAWIGGVLSDIGRDDIAYRLLACRNYPSWLYPVTQGATTVWERLNSYVATEGFPAGNRMNSFNHYSFGSIGAWMIERSLGITYSHDGITIQPCADPTRHLTYAKGHYDSRHGRIESAWQRLDSRRTLYTFTIPKGQKATVILPNRKPKTYKAGTYRITVTQAK